MGGRTTTTKPPKPPIRLPKGYKERTLSKPQPTFLVVTKKRGKIVKLYPKPLILTDAKDLLAYSVDNNLTKTAWFRPLGSTKKVIKPPKIIQGYFEKVRGKLRPYRIREGKKRLLRNGFIEKRRFGFDTLGERRQLSTLQKGRVRTRTKKKVVKRVMPKTRVRKRVFKKRKITLAQRKVLLANLKKARAARKRR